MKYVYNSIRHDLLTLYDAAYGIGIPGAKETFTAVESASDQELLAFAVDEGFDLSSYVLDENKEQKYQR